MNALVYSYDRLGRKTQVVRGGTATTTWTYNDQNQPLTESNTGGPLDGISVTNGYDGLLRRTNLATLKSGVLTSTLYDYDAASRLQTVSDGTNLASYSYLANSPLVSQIAFTNSGALRMTTTKHYDYLNRLTSISSADGSSVILDSHAYAYNTANQRTSVTNTDGTYCVFGYDELGQVTSSLKYWPDGTLVAGQQFGYNFDDIGNRISTASGGDQWGRNLRYANYSANNLNQYTNRTVPGAVDIIGSATNTATVTVNNLPTYRHSNYFRVQLPLANSLNPVWQSVTNLAVFNSSTNYIVQTNITGNVFLPKTPEIFAYDPDGNLTNDGRWIYTWDAENRLVAMTNNASVPTGAQMQLNFAYDDQSRRISKSVNTNGTVNTLTFVYDGWNLQAILNSSSSILAQSFTWGLDLSGSLQGAGGVGGLLFKSQSGANASFLAYDGNGNVSALLDATTGTIVGQYEYGPFGEVIRTTGLLAKANPFRFSTKYQDDESGFLYYGYRYYNEIIGEWSSRDPVREAAFNQKSQLDFIKIKKFEKSRGSEACDYNFVNNEAIGDIDRLGLTIYKLRTSKGTCGCGINHRYIIGDSGTNSQWSYKLEVTGVDDGSKCCGTTRAIKGHAHYIITQIHSSAADAVKVATSIDDVVMESFPTDSSVDAQLNDAASKLNGADWDYMLLMHDCGTAANLWMDKARSYYDDGITGY